MLLASSLIILTAGLALASPLSTPEEAASCWAPGMPCWQVQKTTDALAEAIRSSTLVLPGREHTISELEAANVNSTLDDAEYAPEQLLAQLTSVAALTTKDPINYLKSLGIKTNAEVQKRAPSPWCWRCIHDPNHGYDLPVEEPEASTSVASESPESLSNTAGYDLPYEKPKPRISVASESPESLSNNAANAVLASIQSYQSSEGLVEKRSAAPQPWCFRARQSCWKLKRHAEPEPWCFRARQSCWKAKRHLNALELAARKIIENK